MALVPSHSTWKSQSSSSPNRPFSALQLCWIPPHFTTKRAFLFLLLPLWSGGVRAVAKGFHSTVPAVARDSAGGSGTSPVSPPQGSACWAGAPESPKCKQGHTDVCQTEQTSLLWKRTQLSSEGRGTHGAAWKSILVLPCAWWVHQEDERLKAAVVWGCRALLFEL